MDTQLEERLTSIETRLSRIEQHFYIPPEKPQKISKSPSFQKRNEPEVTSADYSHFEFLVSKPGNWLGLIAIICFVFAAGFIIKLSIDTGWLTPARQIGLSYLLGLVLIGAGLALLYSDRAYASLLPGAGMIVLYLTTFAAHQFYSLISFETGIFVTCIVSAICIWLYLKIRHDAYAIIAAAGVYLAPLALEFRTEAVFSLYFFIVCSFAFATISIWVRSRALTMIAGYLSILVTGYIGLNLKQDALLCVILPIHFLIFSIGTYLYSLKTREPLTERESWSFFPVLLLFYVLEYNFLYRIHPNLAPWISLLFAALLITLYLGAEKWFPKQSLNSQPMILAFASIVAFHAVYLELLPNDVRPWLFIAITIGFATLPIRFLNINNFYKYLIPILAVLIILVLEYVSMIHHLLDGKLELHWMLVALASVASLWFLIIAKDYEISKKDEYGYAILSFAHILAITAFYRLTIDLSSLAVSASWLLYAIAVIAFAYYRKDKVMALSALVVLSFAAGKALLYDAASAPTIVRILCLLLTGAVLYGAGYLMRKITQWKA